jgi:hypothetical protein
MGGVFPTYPRCTPGVPAVYQGGYTGGTPGVHREYTADTPDRGATSGLAGGLMVQGVPLLHAGSGARLHVQNLHKRGRITDAPGAGGL